MLTFNNTGSVLHEVINSDLSITNINVYQGLQSVHLSIIALAILMATKCAYLWPISGFLLYILINFCSKIQYSKWCD